MKKELPKIPAGQKMPTIQKKRRRMLHGKNDVIS